MGRRGNGYLVGAKYISQVFTDEKDFSSVCYKQRKKFTIDFWTAMNMENLVTFNSEK